MTRQELEEILKAMYALSGTNSDEKITQDQYNYYMDYLNRCAPGSADEKMAIRDVIFALDITKPAVARKIAYPFSYNRNVIRWVEAQIKDGHYYCAGCNCWHPYKLNDTSPDRLTIDHEPALSERFNSEEWKQPRADRLRSYNDTKHMQLMCQRANSSKGGVPYNKDYLQEVFLREL